MTYKNILTYIFSIFQCVNNFLLGLEPKLIQFDLDNGSGGSVKLKPPSDHVWKESEIYFLIAYHMHIKLKLLKQ